MAWSSGKDGALALYRSFSQGDFEVVSLLTTVAENLGRVSVNGVPEALLEKQAKAAKLPLQKIPMPVPCPNAVYEKRWEEALLPWKAQGVTHVIFADVYVENIRRYREEMLRKFGMTAVFPLWGQDTRALSKEMVELGFETVVICVDTRKLPADFAGKKYDAQFLRSLPSGIDPCGENGEFHTFVYGAPFFTQPIDLDIGSGAAQTNFQFAELRSKTSSK